MSIRTQPAPQAFIGRVISLGRLDRELGLARPCGTGWYNDYNDPAEDMTTILVIRWAPAPPSLPMLRDFWTAAYYAIYD